MFAGNDNGVVWQCVRDYRDLGILVRKVTPYSRFVGVLSGGCGGRLFGQGSLEGRILDEEDGTISGGGIRYIGKQR